MEVNISNNDSILTSIKKLMGLTEEYDAFDQDILILINSVLFELEQIGVKAKDGFALSDKTSVWSDYSDDDRLLNALKPYIYMKTKLTFDPPTSSGSLDSMNRIIDRFEWRINLYADTGGTINERE